MLYWFGVYVLVAVAVFLPLLVLYLAVVLLRQGVAAARFLIRMLKSALPAEFSKENWGTSHR
jgi:hypothetical protein